MAMKLITGYTGTKHITPADDAGLHKGIFGEGDFVLQSGSQLAATIQSVTEIQIADGELVMQGRHARNDSEYQAVAIANGTQGMYRNDLIVARYTKNTNTSVESISLVVITGTATSGTATDPAYNTGNIDNGETRDFPLYRVKLNGITISSIDKLFATRKSNKDLEDDIKTLSKAEHKHSASDINSGTLSADRLPTVPVSKGGTGSTTAAEARTKLGLNDKVFTKHTLNSINIDNTAGNWTVDISEQGHGTIPAVFVNVTQTTGDHFRIQIAIKCDVSNSTTGRDQRVWVRDKYSSGVWSEWKYVLTENTGIQMVKLWENPKPTANSFDGQRIKVLDAYSTEYDFIEILYQISYGGYEDVSRMRTYRSKSTGTTASGKMFGKGSTNSFHRGMILWFETGELAIDSGINDETGEYNNMFLLPIAVYGIKGVL